MTECQEEVNIPKKKKKKQPAKLCPEEGLIVLKYQLYKFLATLSCAPTLTNRAVILSDVL